MGWRVLIGAAMLLGLSSTAQAAEAAAIHMRDGPGGTGRFLGGGLGDALSAAGAARGVRLHEDGNAVAGIEALCARLERRDGLTAWAAAPAIAEPPKLQPRRAARVVRPPVEAQADARSEGHVLRARSDGVSRFSGSRAVLITVPRTVEDAAEEQRAGARVTLRSGRKGREIVCPEGSYVQGLRTGTAAGRRGGVRAVQLICTQGNGRNELVGEWPAPAKAKGKRAKAGAALVASRTLCGGGSVNPHDGTAGRALIGAVENGRIVSLGLICARAAVPGPVSEAAGIAALWLAGLTPQADDGARRIHHRPSWYAGSRVAVCRDGSERGDCAQESADLFCMVMHGEGGAVGYEVGAFAEDAIAAGGKRCPAKACRAFRSITCVS